MASVRDVLTVIDKIRRSCIMKRLVDQESQLEVDSLSDRQPVELPQHWRDMITSTSAGDESRCRVLHRQEAPEQTVMPLKRELLLLLLLLLCFFFFFLLIDFQFKFNSKY